MVELRKQIAILNLDFHLAAGLSQPFRGTSGAPELPVAY